MKNKLTANKIAISNLKSKKKQYALMITGIILAMVFASSVLFFVSSMKSSATEMSNRMYGRVTSFDYNADEEIIKKAYDNKVIEEYGLAHIISYGYTTNKNKGTSIAWLDEKGKENSYFILREGAYPTKENEICLEAATLSRLELKDAKIGDNITLDVLTQNGMDYVGEAHSKTYKLVGIAENKMTNILKEGLYMDNELQYTFFPSAFVADNTQTELGGKERLVAYFNEIGDDILIDNTYYEPYYAFLMDCGIADQNNSYTAIGHPGEWRFINTSEQTTINYSIILAVVLLFASCIGIINSFSSNLQERKKQIGLFRTVGATKAQIISIYGREALIIAVLCTPVSVAISYGLVKLITSFMGDNFVFVPDFTTLILSAVFGICMVMLAALIPLISASKISPIQSIRNIEMARKFKSKKIKTQMQFKPSVLMAKRNIKFYKGKQTAVSFFLIFAILFSGFGFSLMSYMNTHESYAGMAADYTIYQQYVERYAFFNIIDTHSYNENDVASILENENVKDAFGLSECSALLKVDDYSNDYLKTIAYFDGSLFEKKADFYHDDGSSDFDKVTANNIDTYYNAGYSQTYLNCKSRYSLDGNYFPVEIVSTRDDKLKNLDSCVVKGKIDLDKINSGEEIILLAPKQVIFGRDTRYGGEAFHDSDSPAENVEPIITGTCPYDVGDELDLSILYGDELENDNDFSIPKGNNKTECKVRVGAIVSRFKGDFYDYINVPDTTIGIITSNTQLKKLYPDMVYKELRILLNDEHSDNVEDEIQKLIEPITDNAMGEYYSSYESAQRAREEAKTMFITMIAIVIIVLSFTASIINNSLSSRIRESKREMGTLRAVGASQKDIVMSYIRQLASMLGWGYGIGFGSFLTLYGIICLVQFKKYGNLSNLELKFNILPTIVACLVLFGVCALNLYVKIKRETKNSIIENIREL